MICASNIKWRYTLLTILLVGAVMLYTNTQNVMIAFKESLPVGDKNIFKVDTNLDEGHCSDVRLKNETIRILWWTTFYSGLQKHNRNITCGDVVCELTSKKELVEKSHVIIFHGWRTDMKAKNVTTSNGVWKYTPTNIPSVRHPDQYWLLFMLESSQNFREHMRSYDALFNWTMTYRTGSDIFIPYGKFLPLEEPQDLDQDSLVKLSTKTKLISWVLSNCRNVSSRRIDLVKKLQEHVPVDIYGKCGPLKCKTKSCKTEISPYYKFYLSLENSLCQEYVTEKVFHAYQVDMVPIVYGSANYDLFLPRGSFININNFPSAKALANYLLYLDKNDDEYVKYFEWKKHTKLTKNGYDLGKGYCDICKKAHQDYPARITKIIPNMTDWLFGNKNNYRVCNEPLIWE